MKFLRLKKAEVLQPNKPKPTTTLPQNMEWSWDPEAADWVAVMKDNNNVTPPLYNPQNQNVVNQNANYMSTVKSASKKDLSVLHKLLEKCWYGSGKGRYADIGNWSIGLGGYDTGYEVSYKGLPIFSITPYNELKEYLSEESLQRECGLSYDDIERTLKSYKDLGGLKRIQCKKQAGYSNNPDYFGDWFGDGQIDFSKIINPEDDGKVWMLKIWGGSGYILDVYLVKANDYEEAIDKVFQWSYDNEGHNEIIFDYDYVYDAALRYFEESPDMYGEKLEWEDFLTEFEHEEYVGNEDYTLFARKENFFADEVPEEYLQKVTLDKKVDSSKKVKSSNKIIKELDESSMEELEKYAKECGDEIWSLLNGSLVHLLAYFPTENNTYKVLYIPIVHLRMGNGDPSYLMLTKDEDYKFYSECDPVNSADFSSLELLPGDDTYKQIGFVRNSSVKCLSEFLDGPKYSKEIKIEAGLIKGGLVAYAGFDFNRGSKYAITEKGLKVLRRASEAEHNEALNEREKLAYLFGFNTDKETTLDTTGKVIKSEENELSLMDVIGRNENEFKYIEDIVDAINHKEFNANEPEPWWTVRRYDVNGGDTIELVDFRDKQYATIKLNKQFPSKYYSKDKKGIEPKEGTFKKQFSIVEADGCELGKVTASSQLDALVKFGIEHPEYADSQSISAKEIKSAREPGRFEIRRVEDYDYPCFYIYDTLKQKPLVYDLNGSRRLYYLSYTDAQDGLEEFENLPDSKELNAQYEQTTNTKEPYPNPSETPTKGVTLENHDGWVNTASEDTSTNGKLVVKSKNNIEKGDILVLDDLFYVMNVEHNGEDYLRDEDRNRLAVCTLKEVHGPMKITQFIPLNKLPDNVNVLEGYSFHNK